MKYTLSIEDKKKLSRLFQTKDDNINVADIYNEFLDNNPSYISQNDIVSLLKEGKSEEEAYWLSFCDAIDMDPEDEMVSLIASKYHMNEMKRLNPEKYLNNPYLKNMRLLHGKSNRWELTEDYFAPYEGFIYQDTITEEDTFREITSFGYFPTTFQYFEILQDNKVWMSITPHEIETMEKPIEEAKGRVVAFGLGLGYFPYMASLKDEVKEIYIVEKDLNAINLFNKEIFPKFHFKDKFKIIYEDAFEYLENDMEKEHFDFAFVDIWHTPDDGLELYLKAKKYASAISKTVFSYWIEESMIAMLRRALITLIQEENEGSTDDNYQKEENFSDHLINRLHFIFKDVLVTSYQQIHSMLSDEELKKTACLI
ncbi:MAG: hypothetical protein LKJ88_00365 [Bacilli bacterium]|jgi:hypothetical protein|nr:hypothetical protein [Bacilli bacterium]